MRAKPRHPILYWTFIILFCLIVGFIGLAFVVGSGGFGSPSGCNTGMPGADSCS